MANININIKNMKKGLVIDVNETAPTVDKEEKLLVEIIMITLSNMIDVYCEGFNFNLKKTEIVKTAPNNKNEVVNRIMKYNY